MGEFTKQDITNEIKRIDAAHKAQQHSANVFVFKMVCCLLLLITGVLFAASFSVV